MSVLNDVKYLNSSCKTPVWRWRSCLSKQMNHMAQTLCSILWNVSDLEYNFNLNLFKCIEWSETAGTKHCFGKWGGGQTCPKSWQAKNEKNKKADLIIFKILIRCATHFEIIFQSALNSGWINPLYIFSKCIKSRTKSRH